MALEPAHTAAELRLRRSVAGLGVPADRAPLAAVPGVHPDQLATTILRFARDHRNEASPGASKDLPIEPRLLGDPGTGFLQAAPGRAAHVGDLQVLEHQK